MIQQVPDSPPAASPPSVARNHSAWVWAGYVALAALAVYIGRKTTVYFDDVYITLSYARNLAAGAGMVFQPGERVLGTTTPLWCWLNALGFLIFSPTAHGALATHWLFIAATLGAAAGIVRLARRAGWGEWGFLGAAGYILLPQYQSLFGAETSLAVWLGCELLLAFAGSRLILAGALGALLTLTRPEAGLLVALVAGAELLWHGRLARDPNFINQTQKAEASEIKNHGRDARATKAAAILVLTAALCIAPALIFLTWFFGSPIPNTLAAKQVQLKSAWTPWTLTMAAGAKRAAFEWLRGPQLAAWLGLAGLFGTGLFIARGGKGNSGPGNATLPSGAENDANQVIGVPGNVRAEARTPNNRQFLAFALALLWAPAHVAALSVLGVAYYDWYLYPFWLGAALAVSAGAALAARVVRGIGGPESRLGAVALSAAALALLLAGWQQPWNGEVSARQRARCEGYRQLAQKIGERAHSGDAVLTYEIGVLRFYLPPAVRVIDELKLVQKINRGEELPGRAQLVTAQRPRFLIESHPIDPQPTQEQQQIRRSRLDPAFRLEYGPIKYHPIEKIDNAYGLQILLERD